MPVNQILSSADRLKLIRARVLARRAGANHVWGAFEVTMDVTINITARKPLSVAPKAQSGQV